MSTKVFIDTNVILRLILGDVPQQQAQAERLFSQIEAGEYVGVLSLLVVNELFWIAQHYYRIDRRQIGEKLLKLLRLKHIQVIEISKASLVEVLEQYMQERVDLTDVYLVYVSKENQVASFDKDISKLGAKQVNFTTL